MGISHTIRRHIRKILLLIVLLLIPIILIATERTGRTNIAIYNPPYSVTALAQIIGAIGSVALSGLLAFLYLMMFRTQRQQVETMQQQKEWMEVQHRPEVRVADYNISDTNSQAREKVEVELQNAGNGLAKNLYIRCDVRVSNEEWKSEPVEDLVFNLDDDRFKIEPRYSWLRPPEEARESLAQRTFSKQTTGGFLHAGQQQWYEAPVWLNLVEEDEDGEFSGGQGLAIQDAMIGLHEAGVKSVLLQVSAVYRDMGGNIGLEQVFASPASLDERYTLKQIDASSGGGALSQTDLLEVIRENNPFPPDSLRGNEN